ncbi:hypothetical protein, partial [Escherichia coli]|uniref:hypothetical protein n=1 Tax=Escherichia coli TaxID=562 RepID=UPI001BDB870B
MSIPTTSPDDYYRQRIDNPLFSHHYLVWSCTKIKNDVSDQGSKDGVVRVVFVDLSTRRNGSG